ncbi:hypothetical protein [Chryseobacterium taihuense]|uniref:Uncharacterized protein n=1 Tax=Chryseobacterium taihuense TaxID=1141221 RepID=A0ABY0QVR1_9FLAO|nr:hypothetical protein [Chryseobacterium taihuense]SDL98681.1 hypothetical protein SAMN05216273_11029 [Chryseobacterium taihuense]
MTRVVLRLEFHHIFPKDEKKDIIEYLKLISKFSLENIIGFFNSNPSINFDNFFSNPVVGKEIFQKVKKYCIDNNIYSKPEVVSTEASIKISEIILANKDILITNNTIEDNTDRDEINLFKAFLLINETINKSDNLSLDSSTENIDKISDIMIALKFSTSDIGVYEDVDSELLKLAYVTSYKFESLLKFLSEKEENEYLIDELCSFFKQTSIIDLKKQVDFLVLQILLFRQNKSFKFKVDEPETIAFLDSLISEQIEEDSDFLHLRNYPLYKMDKETYTIINAFFVLDKFTKSIKFLLKDCFNKKNNLKVNDRTFFNFYNKDFSENYLMKNVLNNIFSKKYFNKHEVLETKESEPDYYIRHNKDLYIFEYKDVLIAKDVKISSDINKITKTLEGKFLTNPNNGKRIGIGQIITHIEAISSNNFIYDKQIKKDKSYNIYPILLLSDRTLEIPGINHMLNKWFIENLNVENKYLNVKKLTIIDLDTLIFYEQYLKNKDKNFKNLLDEQLSKMSMSIKGYGKNIVEFENNVLKKITQKLAPFSSRFRSEMFNQKLFIERFLHLSKEEIK